MAWATVAWPAAEAIAACNDSIESKYNEDVSACFTNNFTVVRPVRRINVDLTQGCCESRTRGRRV